VIERRERGGGVRGGGEREREGERERARKNKSFKGVHR